MNVPQSVKGKVEEQVRELKRSIVEITESVGFEEIVERAELLQKEEYKEE